MTPEAKDAVARVLMMAEWLERNLPMDGFSGWLLSMVLPSACLEEFRTATRRWSSLPADDRLDVFLELG